MHKPSKKTNTYEKCYTCDLRVNGYVELMNHKNEAHPPNKKCRNLERGTCRFGNRCWYVHEEEVMNTDETKQPKTEKFECNIYGDVSKTRDEIKKHRQKTHATLVTKSYEKCYTCDSDVNGYVDLMNHRKDLHPSNKKCRKFDDGVYQFENRCWYVHEEEIMDTDEAKKI